MELATPERPRRKRKPERESPRAREARLVELREHSLRERLALREGMREVTSSRRCKACGLPGKREDGSVVLRATRDGDGWVAGLSGLFSCGNVWVCPMCSAKISAARAEQLAAVLASAVGQGCWAVLVTLTTRHYRGHTLAQCLDAVSKGWRRATSGRDWQDEREAAGFAGYCRALEITHGPNGWHVHVHVVVVFDSRPTAYQLDRFTDGMFVRWSAGVVATGLPAPTAEHGIDVQALPDPGEGDAERLAEWSRYVTKGLAAEATLSASKDAKGHNRSVRELMRDAFVPRAFENPDTGDRFEALDDQAVELLREYETVMHGRRQLTWSQRRYDLRKRFTPDAEELTDEAIADEEFADRTDDVAVLPRASYEGLRRSGQLAELLITTSRRGPLGARSWLDDHGVEWWAPTRLTDQRRYGEPPGSA